MLKSLFLSLTDPKLLPFWFAVEFVSIVVVVIGCGGEVWAETHEFHERTKSDPESGRLSKKKTPEQVKHWWNILFGILVVLGLAVELLAFGLSFFGANREIDALRERTSESNKLAANANERAGEANKQAAEARERAALVESNAMALQRDILSLGPRRISPEEQSRIAKRLSGLRGPRIRVFCIDEWETLRLARQISDMLDTITFASAVEKTWVGPNIGAPFGSAQYLMPEGVTVEANPADPKAVKLADALVEELNKIEIKTTRSDFFHDVSELVSRDGRAPIPAGMVAVWVGVRPSVAWKHEGSPFILIPGVRQNGF